MREGKSAFFFGSFFVSSIGLSRYIKNTYERSLRWMKSMIGPTEAVLFQAAFSFGFKTIAFGSDWNGKVRPRSGSEPELVGTNPSASERLSRRKSTCSGKKQILFTNHAECNTLPPVMVGACVPGFIPPFSSGEWGEGILGGGIGGKIRGKMICGIGRQERAFQARHFKACPVAVEDGAAAAGGGTQFSFMIHEILRGRVFDRRS
jgi:hypothetical protein